MNPSVTVPSLLPSITPSHRSPWPGLIQRAGLCVCDQSGQTFGPPRNKYVLTAQGEQPCSKEMGRMLYMVPSLLQKTNGVNMRPEILYIFFTEQKLVLTVTAQTLLAQLYKGFSEIQSLFTQPLCHIEIKHKTMPRHRGVLFMERSLSQMTGLLQPTAVAGKSQTSHRWAKLWSSEKRSEWKMWALSLWTLDCSFRPSLLRLSLSHAPLPSSAAPL